MNQWTDITPALDALDPIAHMTRDQRDRLFVMSESQSRAYRTPTVLRRRLAGGLLKLAILLDGRAQLALTEARGQR
jgi:hypothetical protein